MKNALKLTALVLCCVALVACSQKGPAEAALNTAQAAVDGVKADAAMYAPDQAKALLASMTGAREAFDKGDYKAALAAAQAIPAKAQEAATAIAAKKDELTKAWTELSASVPGMVEQVKTKVDALAAMKKLPKGMDKAEARGQQDGARGDREGVRAKRLDAFKAGNLTDAVAKGKAVQGEGRGRDVRSRPDGRRAGRRRARRRREEVGVPVGTEGPREARGPSSPVSSGSPR